MQVVCVAYDFTLTIMLVLLTLYYSTINNINTVNSIKTMILLIVLLLILGNPTKILLGVFRGISRCSQLIILVNVVPQWCGGSE